MSFGSAKKATVQVWTAMILTGIVSSCATTKVEPLPPLPEAPKYVQVPHPEGLEFGDLMAIFTEQGAPAPASLKGCEGEFTKLRKSTLSKEELLNGARELVKRDPTKYHWCFYGLLMTLETQVKEMAYIDERQKAILDAYLFLTPIARAFHLEYQDSRYLRWAVQRYRRFSEYVFYRRLEPTPQTNAELVGMTQPWGAFRAPAAERGVLDKYGIVQETAKTSEAPADPANPVVEEPKVQIEPPAQAPVAAEAPVAQPAVTVAPVSAAPVPAAPAPEVHSAIVPDPQPKPVSVAPVAPAVPAAPLEAKLQVPAESPPVAPIEMTPAPLTANPLPAAPVSAQTAPAPVSPVTQPARSPASAPAPAALPDNAVPEMAPLPE